MNHTHQHSKIIIAAALTASLALPSIVAAGELTLKPAKFSKTLELNAVALPQTTLGLSVKPKVWTAFKIKSVLAHGAKVKKGEALIEFDTEALDKKITALEKDRVKQLLVLQAAKQSLAEQEVQNPISLAKAKLAFDQHVQDYGYYKKVLRPMNLDQVDWAVKVSTWKLSYAQEELDQLLKMYKADGLTEETEEIIITRAKQGLVSGERSLARTKVNAAHQLEVAIPRADDGWMKKDVQAKIAWKSAQASIPRSLKIKREDVAKSLKQDQETIEMLAKLKADRKLMNFVAPADGVVYYGEFKNGIWNSSLAAKVLRVGAGIPAKATVMTVVPTNTKIVFSAFLDAAKHAQFKATQAATIRMAGNSWTSFPVKSSVPSDIPNLTHKWQLGFTPVNHSPAAVIGSKGTISVVVFDDENVLTVPAKAVTKNADGTNSVKVKMAEGDPKSVPVKVGREAGGRLEILSGITAGQVIVTP